MLKVWGFTVMVMKCLHQCWGAVSYSKKVSGQCPRLNEQPHALTV